MNDIMPFALPIALPILVGAIALPFLRKHATALAWTSLLTVILALLASIGFLTNASASASIPWLGMFDLSFSINGWKAFLLGFLFLFQILNGIYLVGSVSRIPRPWLFTTFALVAFGSACGAILAQNVLILLIGWELVLVSLYAMILSGGEGTDTLAYKALIINGASDFFLILGLMIFEHIGGKLDLSITNSLSTGSSFAAFASFVFMFLGAGSKAGMWPFQSWIPEASEKMPTAGFAALPATLGKVLGVYVLFLICNKFFALNAAAKMVMFTFAIVTIFTAIAPALVERNFKKVIAFLTISPVGFMVAGMATSMAAGMAGALMLMLAHVISTSGMFYAAGNLEQSAGGSSLEAIEGRKMILPQTVVGFLLAATAVIALPPTGGFMAKDFLFKGLLEQHHFLVFFFVWVGAILNIAVVLKLSAVLLSGWKTKEKGEVAWSLMLPVLVLGLMALLGGFVMDLNGGWISSVVGGTGSAWIRGPWNLTSVSVAALGTYVLGMALFFALRHPGKPEWSTFHFLRESAVLSRVYDLAEAKTFDAYEIGIKVVQWIANVVFWRVERLIDRVFDWFIRTGRAIARPSLSAIHNGVYSNYLAWVIAGFALVSALVLLR